ncbi:hypothetical protein pb186bvf_009042 [Paramecium bursaria]
MMNQSFINPQRQIELLNQELKIKNFLKDQHQAQLKQQKELYETENKDLKNKLIQFNDEVEELKKVYKEKNLKLYNLVLQLEKEKQELIEKNIQLLESQSNTKQQFNIHNLVEERTRILIEQIQQLEERNAKLQVEKNKIEEKYMNQLQNSQVSQIPQRTNRSSDRKPPPVPDHNRSIQTQSFEQLPPANKSILKNSKIQLSATKTKEKENLTPHNRSKILDTPKSQRKQPTSRTQSAQKKVKTKKQIYSKVK